MIKLSNKLLMLSPTPPVVDTSPVGGQTFLIDSGNGVDSVNTFTYIVPTNVNYISAVAIGPGGSGGDTGPGSFVAAGGGGGGSLAYSNKIPVTPGETLTITVGNRFISGANSSISRGNTVLLLAQGGYTGSSNNAGGIGGLGGQATNCIGQVCFSGGNGGNGTAATVIGDSSGYKRGAGGGGAAGYAGNGGNGSSLGSGNAAPTGGGGGGGANTPLNGAVGGGVGLYGLGSSGAGGIYSSNTAGGSEGDTGSSLDGGTFNTLRAGNNTNLDYDTGAGGGGGGARYFQGIAFSGEPGTSGAVRIIHGPNETFPVNCTTNNISFIANTVSNETTIAMPSSVLPGDLFILYDYADYDTSEYTGALRDPLYPDYFIIGSPTGWTRRQALQNSSTFTILTVSSLQATELNATSLQNSIVTGNGGTGNKSKVLLQFRSEKTLAVYTSIASNLNTSVIEQTSAPGTTTITPTNAFPYSNGMSIVSAFFKADNPITAGSDIGHTNANYVNGAAGTNTIVSYKIYGQTDTSYSSQITMLDSGTNTFTVNHFLGY